MSEQLGFDLELAPDLVDVELDRTLSIREQWLVFHAANPAVYSAIVRIARDLRARGFERCGIALIFERLRWLHAIRTQGDDYRLNHNWRAWYAREVMAREPDLADFFEIRRLRSPGCEEPPAERDSVRSGSPCTTDGGTLPP
jgi:hypothetical protein